MAMEERNLETVLDAVAEKIRSLKMDLMVKDMEIGRLREANEKLKAEVENLTRYIEEGENNETL